MTVTEVPGLIPCKLPGALPAIQGLDAKGFVDALKDVDALLY